MKTNFRKMNVNEYLEMCGLEEKDISMCDKKIVCVYLRSDFEGSSLGCKYENGEYSVIGGGRDCMCDYKYMFSRVMSC